MARQAFVHEAVLVLADGEDSRRPGAMVTVELCGHWEHDGPCRWPHHTAFVAAGGELVVRTTFAAEPEEREALLRRIRHALESAGGWQVRSAGEAVPTAEERQRAERWYDMPLPEEA